MDIRRIVAFIAGACLPLITAWLAGFDFDERGVWAAFLFIASIVVGVLGFVYPFKNST